MQHVGQQWMCPGQLLRRPQDVFSTVLIQSAWILFDDAILFSKNTVLIYCFQLFHFRVRLSVFQIILLRILFLILTANFA